MKSIQEITRSNRIVDANNNPWFEVVNPLLLAQKGGQKLLQGKYK